MTFIVIEVENDYDFGFFEKFAVILFCGQSPKFVTV